MKNSEVNYQLLDSGAFVIENYNRAKPFSSFLPGVAGLTGIPLWCFYVNRGQGVVSFGASTKDEAILEFQPANRAYQLTSTNGFRTFIKNESNGSVYEPFKTPASNEEHIQQSMTVTSYDFSIKETNTAVGLETNVNYYTIPNENFASLARVVTLKNISNEEQSLSMLDGLPAIVPYGMNNWLLKHMARTAEAWIQAQSLNNNEVGYFNLKVEVIDSPEVKFIEAGHFYSSFTSDGKSSKPSKVIYDPELIFGNITDNSVPELFFDAKKFDVPKEQIVTNKTPCAFGHSQFKLKPNETVSVITTIGRVENQDKLKSILKKIQDPEFIQNKGYENRDIIQGIENRVATKSSSAEFDQYNKQSFLDNILRGGLPHPIQTKKDPFVFHVFWRKHGDLERDYNHFQVAPTYYAQGNANYRDVNQNRRMDPWIDPDVAEANITTFLNLSQLDGYNPLVLRGVQFQFVPSEEANQDLKTLFKEDQLKEILDYLVKPVSPGEFIMWLEEKGFATIDQAEKILSTVLSYSNRFQEIDPSEGFWVDHWHYNLDLMQSYLSLYPDKWNELFFERKDFTFYDNCLTVRPRKDKHVLHNGNVRQFGAINHDHEKEKFIQSRTANQDKVRVDQGKGDVYHTSLVVKLTTLLLNKISTLDPFGVGVEMEADRPNWYDALNGLPGLLGSSISETFEIKRLIQILQTALDKSEQGDSHSLNVPFEIGEFFNAVDSAFASDALTYWNQTAEAKEAYREKIYWGIEGKEETLSACDLKSFLEKALIKINQAIEGSWNQKENAPYSYCINEVTEYEEINGKTNGEGKQCVTVKKFEQKPIPLFLEGVVHAMRLGENVDKNRALYKAVQKSDLYDKQLGMYKVNASIQEEPMELGRNRVFSPGWLENGSVFMHMEFKYLMECLRNGLVDEFYTDLHKAAPAFLDPKIYGRSVVENSTFIASTNNPDPRTHGRGFVARLSGTNAEWVHIFHLITVGTNPFDVNEKGELVFSPQPLIKGDLFTTEGTFQFRFLSAIDITYINPSKKDTYGKNAPQVKKWIIEDNQGNKSEVEGPTLSGNLAHQVRNRQIKTIQIELS